MDLETGGQELCDSLCSSADVIIAKTEAMVHQTHTELPAFSQSLNMCDVTSLIVKPSQTHTELPSFPQSLNMCDVIAHHTKPSVHHSVEVVPILSYEIGIRQLLLPSPFLLTFKLTGMENQFFKAYIS